MVRASLRMQHGLREGMNVGLKAVGGRGGGDKGPRCVVSGDRNGVVTARMIRLETVPGRDFTS